MHIRIWHISPVMHSEAGVVFGYFTCDAFRGTCGFRIFHMWCIQTIWRYENSRVKKCWKLHLKYILFESLFESGSNLPATTDQYRQITTGHFMKYYRKQSGKLLLAIIKTKDMVGDRDRPDPNLIMDTSLAAANQEMILFTQQ